jgi:hypothetical protein
MVSDEPSQTPEELLQSPVRWFDTARRPIVFDLLADMWTRTALDPGALTIAGVAC